MKTYRKLVRYLDKGATILIVDDWEINVQMLEKILVSLGYKTISAGSAMEATELMNDELPQLILLDIMMPDIDGFEFCHMLKENPRTRDIPVIFVSAAESDDEREKAFGIGGVDFIRKPFDVTEIKTRVSTHLNLYLLRQAMEESNRKLNNTINEQRKVIFNEKKRILENLANYFAEENKETQGEAEKVSKNSRMLAQALNFSDRYENKISSAFVDGVEIAGYVRNIKPKIFEIFFSIEDEDATVKAVSDVIYHYKDEWSEDKPLAAQIVAVADLFMNTVRGGATKEAALYSIQNSDSNLFDPYILELFIKLEKQIKS